MTTSDHLGVYRVAGMNFHSKLEAIEMHARTGHHPHWDFNEAVFSSYDWTQEPTESLQELYRQRAQQLRDRYDYIVLFWSGGADSENVRTSFMDNDIKLDELVSLSNYHASKDKWDFFNSELFARTLPQSRLILEQYPWIKFRVIDQSLDTVEYFNRDNRFDWIYNSNMMLTPNCASRDGIGMKVKEWADMVIQGKKLCLLWGHDKPRIFHEHGRYLFRFIDIVDNGPTVSSMAGRQPYSDELFYWSPELPKIVIKQAHMVKRYLDENLFRSPFISRQKSSLAFKEHEGQKFWLDSHGLHTIIYPGWDIHTFDAGKPKSLLFSPRDQWFFDLAHDNLSRMIWQQGVTKLAAALPDYWKNDPNDISKGIKACWSREYYLD